MIYNTSKPTNPHLPTILTTSEITPTRPSPSTTFLHPPTSSSYFIKRLSITTTLSSHTGCVNTLSWNSSGQYLLSGSDDTHLNIWNPFSDSPLLHRIKTGHNANIFSAHFLTNSDTRLISCAANGIVRYTLIDSSQPLPPFKCHTEPTYSVLPHRVDPNIFYSCSEDGTINRYDLRVNQSCHCRGCNQHLLFDVNTWSETDSSKSKSSRQEPQETEESEPEQTLLFNRLLHRLFTPSSQNGITAFDTHPFSPSTFLIATTNGTIYTHDDRYPTSQPTSTLEYDPELLGINSQTDGPKISDIKYSLTGSKILCSYSSGPVALLHPLSNPTHLYKGHRNKATMIKSVSFFGKDENHVMCGSDDGGLYIWDAETTDIVAVYKGDENVVNAVAPNPCLPVVAVSGIDDSVKVFEAVGGGTVEFVRVEEEEEEEEEEDEGIGQGRVIVLPPGFMAEIAGLLERGIMRGGGGVEGDDSEEEEEENE